MSKSILNAAASALLAGSLSAAPFMAIGTSSEIFLTGDVSLSFNDNVTLGNDVVVTGQTQPFNPVLDDVVWRLSPGFSYEFGRNALITGAFAYTETIAVYSDNSDLDSSLSHVRFNAAHDDGGSTTKISASFQQLNQNTVDFRLPELSRRDVIMAKVEHEMEISAKSSVLFGLDWRETDYARATFTDRSIVALPLRYYWEYSPKVDLSFGGQYRRIDTDFSTSSSDDFLLNFGARGDFTAKLKGFVRVGMVDRSTDNGSSRTSFNMSSNLTYLYSEKTTLTAGISNDFGNSGIGENQENFDMFLGLRAEIAPEFALRGRVSNRNIDYFTRGSDQYTEASFGGEYTVNEYFQVIGLYSYKNNESDLASGDFDNSIFSITAKLRY
jgi:hypothetical protein